MAPAAPPRAPARRRPATPPPPRSRRPEPPARRGTPGFGLPNAVAGMAPPRRLQLEVDPDGSKVQVPVVLPPKDVSAPPNPFGVLPIDVTGDEDPKA